MAKTVRYRDALDELYELLTSAVGWVPYASDDKVATKKEIAALNKAITKVNTAYTKFLNQYHPTTKT